MIDLILHCLLILLKGYCILELILVIPVFAWIGINVIQFFVSRELYTLNENVDKK